ncbi:polyamine aminopropyltransferase [Sulfurimicrobium lacus]|uniref:Polyamine aminopropyltransferase n=1 Tax=Sulfurimicrobium lacus TaxID=2715678 RepID=A0A6F8VAN7_9PROT|nr:fused MFS/spermidine synthase [Sulfurimicrobium lacus]BCB26032.1 polyamine aminopropyltransferase [Sulfurimicrobium lacus]
MDFSIDIRESRGLRTLHFDGRWMQGAMRITRPWDLELEYTQVMMACLLMRDESSFPRNILLIGLGAASLTKFLYRNCPLAHLTVVEIDARVVDAAREHFGLPHDPVRLNMVIGDGVDFMMASDQTFDLILVDGFNEHAHPGDLNSLPFYQACRSRLSNQGMLAANLIGLCRGVKGGFAHIESAFEDRALMFPQCKSGNTIAFAATAGVINVSLDELKKKSLAFEQRTGLALLPALRKLEMMWPASHSL